MAGPRTTRLVALSSTRFGRRIFGVFVASALVPIAALAALSAHRVSAELHEQSARRLHAASRAVGMRMLEHLVEVRSALAASGAALRPEDPLRGQIAGLAVLDPSGEMRPILGAAVPRIEPSDAERATLASGGAVFRLVESEGARLPILLVGRVGGSWLAARLREDLLFDAIAEDMLPPEAVLCIFDVDATPLRCSLPGRPSPPPPLEEQDGPRAVEWSHAGTDYLAVPWLVFLRANFHHPGVTVVVAEPSAAVYAPIAGFRTNLFLVSGLALLLVSFLSVQQIRRRLVPLERLRDGTRRLAESDFSARIELGGGDELAELAASFNAMAQRLETHFHSLEKVIEIDRGILSARDEDALAAAFLAPLQRVYPCQLALLAVHGGEKNEPLRVYLRDAIRGSANQELPAPSREERAHWRSLTAEQRMTREELPVFCRSLVENGPAEFAIFPLSIDGETLGLFVAGGGEASAAARESVLYVRQLCDQLAAALQGARLRAQNERLERYDPLTGLPNARWLEEELARATAGVREGSLVALGRLAVEGLDRVRSTFGSEEVDRVVRALAERLGRQEGVRAAHLLGGEFAVLAEAGADIVARNLRWALLAGREVVEEDERTYLLRVRAGAAVAPLDAGDAAGLLRAADAALRHAQERESQELVFYAEEMNETLERRVRLESDLARAIERGELRLHYQPIVDAATRRIAGAEALVRWQHATLGLLEPSHFIPLAEEIGLIGAIGSWVLRSACLDIASWQAARLPLLRVSVNIAAQQVRGPGLRSEVATAIAAAGIRPEWIGLELTESSLMGEEASVVETLESIHRSGVELSLDDFGTGYSSLGYLRRFPLDALKLDRVFVQGVTHEPDKRAITEAVLAMARELGLRVVAEGVETEEQLAFLRERGCPFVQGFLFSPPLAADAFRKLLREQDPE